jgi:hypothetical protein
MNFTRDFLNEILICRESIKVLLEEGTVVTINSGDEFTRINDIVAVSENYGDYIGERVQIKRKYGQYASKLANSSAPIRDKVIEFVGAQFVTKEDLDHFFLDLSKNRGKIINQKQWFDRNDKYFQSFKNAGKPLLTLSIYGKRVLQHILQNKKTTNEMVKESIGLFKFNSINEAMIPISNRSIGKYKSKVDTSLIDKLVKQISPVLNTERTGTLTPKVYEEIIIAISKVISGYGVLTVPQFVFENELNEGAVDLSKQFALVRTGGSIGTRNSFPIFVGRDMGNVIETGDDKDALVAMKSRMNKSLSPGDKKYYGISHKVVELTNGKRKQINDLIALQNKSENEDVISESRIVYPEEQIKKECISRLSDFFGCAPGNLSKFKFDGKDSIKDLTHALNATSYEGAEAYYKVAIEMAKRDLGL